MIAALGAEEPVMRSLARLRTEFEACLFRLGHFLLIAPDGGGGSSSNSASGDGKNNSSSGGSGSSGSGNSGANNKGHGRRKSSSGGAGSGVGGAASARSAKQNTANRTRRRDRFLENNYALVGTVLEGVEGRMAEEVRGYFEGLSAGLAGDVPE